MAVFLVRTTNLEPDIQSEAVLEQSGNNFSNSVGIYRLPEYSVIFDRRSIL